RASACLRALALLERHMAAAAASGALVTSATETCDSAEILLSGDLIDTREFADAPLPPPSALVPVDARDIVGESNATRPVANAAQRRAGSRSLAARTWSLLRDPDEDRFLTALFAHLAPIVATLHSVPLERLGVKPADMVADTDARLFARSLQYAAKM